MKKSKIVNFLVYLALVSAINWGLIALFGVNIVSSIAGAFGFPILEKTVYIAASIGGILGLVRMHRRR